MPEERTRGNTLHHRRSGYVPETVDTVSHVASSFNGLKSANTCETGNCQRGELGQSNVIVRQHFTIRRSSIRYLA
jgi:hypothetical protein